MDIIKELNLEPHPEGGYYRRTYCAEKTIAIDGKDHPIASAIYYYLSSDDFSAWHRLQSDELLHFYTGSPVTVHYLQDSELKHVRLGDLTDDFAEVAQFLVPANTWFAMELGCDHAEALIGATCFPAFTFEDHFELGNAEKMCAQFPEHEAIIKRLTR
jgi:uncharacterized protein